MGTYLLSHYVYSFSEGEKRGNMDQKRRKKPNRVGFLEECLYPEGKNPIAAPDTLSAEPTSEQAIQLLHQTGGIISIAHPNFSWK